MSARAPGDDRCKDCPAPHAPGKARCRECQRRHNEASRARRLLLKRKRRCWVCAGHCVKDGAGHWLTSCEAHRGTEWRTSASGA